MFLSVGKGMVLYLCIGYALEGRCRKVFYVYKYMYVSGIHDSMTLAYLYDNMRSMSLMVSIL